MAQPPHVFAVRGDPCRWETGVLGSERCRTLRPAASNMSLWSPIPARREAWLARPGQSAGLTWLGPSGHRLTWWLLSSWSHPRPVNRWLPAYTLLLPLGLPGYNP